MLGTLKSLLYLDVSKNNLEMVDEQICGCESLQDLLLSNNALTQLPGSIGEDYSSPTHTHTHTHTPPFEETLLYNTSLVAVSCCRVLNILGSFILFPFGFRGIPVQLK